MSNPNDSQRTIEALLQRGRGAHEAGRLAEAEELYRKIIERQTDHGEALHLLGVLCLQTGRAPEAGAYISRSLQCEPAIAEAHYNLGLALVGQGRAAEAAKEFRRAVELAPDFARAYNNLGNALKEQGDLEGAQRHYRRGLELDPANAAAHNNLGVVLHDSGKDEEAIGHYERAIVLDPGDADAHYNLGNALCTLGRWEQSLAAYERAIRLQPELVDAHANLGMALLQLGRLREAEACQRQALRLKPDLPGAYANLGAVMEGQGRLDEAERAMQRAIELDARSAPAHLGLGNVYTAQGRFEEAQAVYREALRCQSDYAYAYLPLVGVKSYSNKQDQDARKIMELLALPDTSIRDMTFLHFALGKILDDCRAYDEAFSHYREGNALARQKSTPFDRDGLSSFVDRVIRTFDREFFASRGGYGNTSELPVFVVGMPRSATTLVEQIIASHPQARGAGELTKIWELGAGSGENLSNAYPEAVAEIDRETSRILAAEYETHLRARVEAGGSRISDKMPSNFNHLGFIALLFPNARVVHCVRHPLDVGLSIYFQHFRRGNEYAYDLGDIGCFYRQYQRLMEHWQQVLPLRVHRLRYEDLVADPERETRTLIEFLGLPWDERCLAFHKAKRPVQTASAWQVRRPVYSSSIGRWRNYERHLGPLKEALGL